MTQILHFTIGPVQSFVGQARRTRDLWAGSFLLSWMAGQAMAWVLDNDGEIDFPVVRHNGEITDPLLRAIMEKGGNHPAIGTLPNRFKAKFNHTTESTIKGIEPHIKSKWLQLAEMVWHQFIVEIAQKGHDTEKIWFDQINNFWEINWVLGAADEKQNDGAWLDIRKNWRNHWPINQPGDHCTLMGDWQEISGFVRSKQSHQQDEFWNKLQSNKTIGRLDLRDNERLCAIALVKRLFPKLSGNALTDTIGWIPGGKPEITGNWPSTAYMAAIPWLNYANDHNPNALEDYNQVIKQTLKDTYPLLSSERATHIVKLDKLNSINRQITNLDGNLFHYDALKNFRATPLSIVAKNPPTPDTTKAIQDENQDKNQGKNQDPDKSQRDKILKSLSHTCSNALQGNSAQPFYAILLMDGDNMGKLLQSYPAKTQSISQALSNFARGAQKIVKQHQGVLIYAGGDDVLAILSIGETIQCAHALWQAYGASFRDQPELQDNHELFTLSGAIVYAHYHTPLKSVLQKAHHSLDILAKQQNHRNSLALTVMKTESQHAQWVGSFAGLVTSIELLIKQIKKDAYSNSFFYNLATRYPNLHDTQYSPLSADDKHALILAEYCRGKANITQQERSSAINAVKCLLNASGIQKGDAAQVDLSQYLQLDAAYIARFIVENADQFGRRRGEA